MTFLKSVLKTTAIFLAFANLAHAEGENNMTKDQQDVLATIQTMTSALQKGNIGAVMQTYEEKHSIVFEPGAPVSDAAVARQIFGELSALAPEFSYAGHEVVVEGDIAVHIAPWQMNAQDPQGNVIRQDGLSVAVLRRQADGTWKMVIDNPHGNRLLSDTSN